MHHVVCLKWGEKYPADYVNRLYAMVQRQLQATHDFYCVADHPRGLDSGIQYIPLPDLGLVGWWNKLWLFSPEFPLRGPCLFLDLDIVIARPVDCLFEHEPDTVFCAIQDSVRDEFNTSVMRWQAGDPRLSPLWGHFVAFVHTLETSPIARAKRIARFLRRRFARKPHKRIYRLGDMTELGGYRGDQGWLSDQLRYVDWATSYPRPWCFSFKWGTRKEAHDDCWQPRRDWPIGACIAVFEGKPKPHQCTDIPWVAENWR